MARGRVKTSDKTEGNNSADEKEALWSHLQANATLPSIGKLIEDAMAAIEAANVALKGIPPKGYALNV